MRHRFPTKNLRRHGRRTHAALAAAAIGLAVVGLGAMRGRGGGEGERDLAAIPGPWVNHTVELTGRVDDGDEPRPLSMHYLAAGATDAPRVFLLHGFPDLAYSWREVIPRLSDSFRVIAPDLRGYGASGKPDSGYGLPSLAADVAALIEVSAREDGISPAASSPAGVHLVGHDWGAAVAWQVALEHGSALESLTAVSVPHPAVFDEQLRNNAEQRRRSRYMKLLAAPGAAGVFATFGPARRARLYRANLMRSEGFSDEDLPWYHAAFDTTAEARGPLAYYRELLRERRRGGDGFAVAGPVAVPTLVMWGRDDDYVMSEMAALSCDHVVPGPCEVEVFDGAGHFVHWEDPERFAERWRAFVADTTAGGR